MAFEIFVSTIVGNSITFILRDIEQRELGLVSKSTISTLCNFSVSRKTLLALNN